MLALKERLNGFVASDAACLPLPGAGDTPRRHRGLFDCGVIDLSFARIAEAHTDALAILAEAAHVPRLGALYGVWASDAPPSRVTAEQSADGNWRIEGVKQFCSGADFLDAALVTAHHSSGILLFDIPLHEPDVVIQPSTWVSPAFADTATTAVKFQCSGIADTCRLGEAQWYLNRTGFWHGAIGPAACWAGGAQSLVDASSALQSKDPHTMAHVGALQAGAWNLKAILDQAGREIDSDPLDERANSRIRALKVRHLVERICAETLDRFARATGPRLLAYDRHVVRQHSALTIYIRQCHGERDLAGIP